MEILANWVGHAGGTGGGGDVKREEGWEKKRSESGETAPGRDASSPRCDSDGGQKRENNNSIQVFRMTCTRLTPKGLQSSEFLDQQDSMAPNQPLTPVQKCKSKRERPHRQPNLESVLLMYFLPAPLLFKPKSGRESPLFIQPDVK